MQNPSKSVVLTRAAVICLLVSVVSHAGPVPYRENGLTGYVSATGQVVIEPRFTHGREFDEGVAIVEMDEKNALIDQGGRVVFSTLHTITEVAGPYVTVCGGDGEQRRCGIMNLHGEVVLPLEFQNISPGVDAHRGVAMGVRDGKPVLLDLVRRKWHVVEADFVRGFREGLAPFRREDKWGYLDHQGNIAVTPQFESVDHFRGGVARARLDGAWGIIGTAGEWKLQPLYSKLENPREGLVPFSRDGRFWGVITIDGREVVPPTFSRIEAFSEGLAFAEVRAPDGAVTKVGYINASGEFKVPLSLDVTEQLSPFRNGIAVLWYDSGYFGYVTRDGALLRKY